MADYGLAVDALTRQMTELQVMDISRASNRCRMPRIETALQFDMLATKMAKCTRNVHSERNRELVSFFGVPPTVIAKAWELIDENRVAPVKTKQIHLLWALHYLKEYPGIRPMCSTLKMPDEKTKPDDKTVPKWVWIVVEALALLQDEVIVWDDRKRNDKGTDCLIGVDCKDCRFQQILIPNPRKPGKMMMNKALFSTKLKGPGLRCEVGTSLLSNDIVWLRGPYLPGDWNDISIFRQELKYKLQEAGERAEADDGHIGESPDCIICPKGIDCLTNEDKLACNKRAQGRIEVLNRHLTHWKCLDSRFVAKGTSEEKAEKHRLMFTACVVLKQIGMDLGVGELYRMGDEYF